MTLEHSSHNFLIDVEIIKILNQFTAVCLKYLVIQSGFSVENFQIGQNYTKQPMKPFQTTKQLERP